MDSKNSITQQKQKTMSTKHKTPSTVFNEEFRVKPGLSMKGREIMTRLKNRSLNINPSNNHSLEEAYDEIRRLDKKDLIRKSRENQISINNHKLKLEKLHGNKSN